MLKRIKSSEHRFRSQHLQILSGVTIRTYPDEREHHDQDKVKMAVISPQTRISEEDLSLTYGK